MVEPIEVTPAGATVDGGRTRFRVWAPDAERVEVVLDGASHELTSAGGGYWSVDVDGVGHGDRYAFSLDGGDPLPDPASGWQPEGVHGRSAVVDPTTFVWTDDAWRGHGLDDTVLYELHVGTFTPGGTFASAIGQLERLTALGVTTIELMPVNAFPGARNWGYDGVFPFAVQQSYGGPDGLAAFVDAAHAHGLAVALDVVYNHMGPEGNVLGRYGPYFTDAVSTPWGAALNVMESGSDAVRDYFVTNVVRWVRDFHLDGFRFDAIHAIVDTTARPFWAEITSAARAAAVDAGRDIVLIAESADNDPRRLAPAERFGDGFDAVWCDDVHHSLRVATTGDRHSYYVDYAGTAAELADTVEHRWKFRGQVSRARGRRHGAAVDAAPNRFVAYDQNHDQVGNRPAGDRPDALVTPARRRLMPAAVLLSPYTPMLFQGEEYGERAPFPFFVDHTDPEVLRGTNEGRRAEFAGADWSVEVPEPGDPATFTSAILDPSMVERDERAARLEAMYTRLLSLRREVAVITDPAADQSVDTVGDVMRIVRRSGGATATVLVNLGGDTVGVPADGELRFTSDDADWGGDGASSSGDGQVRLAGWTAALVVSD